MSITPAVIELEGLYRTPFATPLSLVVAQIIEVAPSSPSPGGSRQMIRVQTAGSIGIDVQMFDQEAPLPMRANGGFVRISASPNAIRAIVWERSKATKPTQRVGVIVVRKQAHVEIFTPDQEGMLAREGFGVRVAKGSEAPQTNEPTARPSPAAEQLPLITETPAKVTPAPVAAPSSSALEIARHFGECLAAARTVLGSAADPEDVRMTAKLIYEEKFARRHAA